MSSLTVAGAALFGIIFAVTNLLAAVADKEFDDRESAGPKLPPAA